MIVGAGGIGKSTLLQSIVSQLGSDAYYIEALSPAKTALRDAYAELGDFGEDELKEMGVTRWTVARLVKELIKLLDGRDFVLALDSLDRITIASSEWLKDLAESHVTILGAARQTKKDRELLDRFFWTTKTITLQPLPKAELLEIIKTEVHREPNPVKFQNKSVEVFFAKTVVKSAKGIPLTAVELCRRAAGVDEVTLTFVRETLMEAHGASVKYIDLTPLLFLPLAFLGAMRYLGRGMGNPELYILAGSLTAAAIVIRVLMPRGNKRKKAS